MKNKDEITTELRSMDSEILSGHSAEKVFSVPEDYFGQFPARMMDVIRNMNTDTAFHLPVYKNGPYTVPPQYFETLSDQILSRVHAMENIVTHGQHPWEDAAKANPFAVPEDYFTQFGASILEQISHQEADAALEMEALSPLLAGLKKEQTFTVPENYFNSEVFIKNITQPEVKTKVIQHPSVKSIKWARWAAAAAVMAIFSLGGFHYLANPAGVSDNPSFQQSLAQIPDANIKEWLSSNMDESDINNLGSSIADIKSIKTNRSSLSDFSEKEIKDYLETEVW